MKDSDDDNAELDHFSKNDKYQYKKNIHRTDSGTDFFLWMKLVIFSYCLCFIIKCMYIINDTRWKVINWIIYTDNMITVSIFFLHILLTL